MPLRDDPATVRIPLHLALALLLPLASGCVRQASPRAYATPPPGPYNGPPAYGYPPGPAPAGWSTPPATSPGSIAVAFAQSHIGKPYCWGGTGPTCYDCSGLTQAAWRAAGRTIPRNSSEQLAKLSPSPWEQMQLGDILWRPGHVGIYAGNGWAIAATKTGDFVRYQAASYYERVVRP